MAQQPERKASEVILEEIAKINKRLDENQSKLDSLTTSHKPQDTLAKPAQTEAVNIQDETQTKTHKSLEEMLACPDCFPDIRAKVIQKHRDNTKDEKSVCTRCGSGVKEEWENCPLCGGSDAKRRS